MEWFFYTSFTSRPLRGAIGISGVKGAKLMFSTTEDDSQKKRRIVRVRLCAPAHTHAEVYRVSVIYRETSRATVMGC